MITSLTPRGRWPLAVPSILAVAFAVVACGENVTGPGTDPDPNPIDTATVLPATGYSRSDVTPSGTVVETEDGYTVDGALTIDTGEDDPVTFDDADVRVRFDDSGNMTSISGIVSIPSPHERITFDDPVHAEVGLFTGRYLNQNRDLGILLKDDRDYFVFDFSVALKMNIATGDTGEGATKPFSIKAPVGGRALMVVDYTDPMYFVYGEQDLLGAMGMGWSLEGNIPFVPQRQVADLGAFDGQNIRTGTFPIFKVFSITGTTVDNEYTEVHLTLEDPFGSDLRQGFQQGWNGDFDLDLGVKDIFGVAIPVADGAGGIFAEASVQDVFQGHAYGVGHTTEDFSWWPSFLPVKPASELGVEAYVTQDFDYLIGMDGQYGWEFPDGVHGLQGAFSISPEATTLEGSLMEGEVVWTVGAAFQSDQTSAYLEPPEQLMEELAQDINDDVLPRIDEAQQRWEDLEAATADYEFELSLRGLRTRLPGIMDAAKAELARQISSELSRHTGTVYYSSLKSQVEAQAATYYATFDNLKAQSRQATDNQATRDAIESALRAAAAKKIFTMTYRYYDPIFGTLLYTVPISRRVMSDAQAAELIDAADSVYRIKETSDVKISMQQIYDQVDEKELFESIRDDIQDGLVVIADIEELGFIYTHETKVYQAYAVIGGVRYELGPMEAFAVDAYAALLFDSMMDALTSN